jgi:hypothetical protein
MLLHRSPALSVLILVQVARSHIPISVPFLDVVAISRPEGDEDDGVNGVECAIISVECFVTGGLEDGLLDTGFVFGGGFRDFGSGHGGKWIDWTWPSCLSGITSSVDLGLVATGNRPTIMDVSGPSAV